MRVCKSRSVHSRGSISDNTAFVVRETTFRIICPSYVRSSSLTILMIFFDGVARDRFFLLFTATPILLKGMVVLTHASSTTDISLATGTDGPRWKVLRQIHTESYRGQNVADD